MSSYIRKQEEGFTIIEIMIVLAIAGLIMLIVFLAVPALQRTARNTQRKADASSIAAAFANFIDNNGSSQPGGLAIDGTDAAAIDICFTGGAKGLGAANAPTVANKCTAGTNYETAKLGYYTPGNIFLDVSLSNSDTEFLTTQVIIDEGYNCNAANTGLGVQNPRTAAILYATENASSTSSQCLEQ